MTSEELLQTAEFGAQGEFLAVEFPWLKRGNAKNKGWQNTVMGQLIIQGDELTIDVNSQVRAEAIKRKITKHLGKRAVFQRALIQSSEKLMEDLANESDRPNEKNPAHLSSTPPADPAVQGHIQQIAAQHWASWIDEPIPALRNETPREAAKTSRGRERLEALPLEYDDHGQNLGADEPAQLFRADIPALRKELGLD